MKQTYTAAVKEDDGWWIGWIEEVPGVNCQERTREELRESLRTALVEAIELNRAEAKSAAGQEFESAGTSPSLSPIATDDNQLRLGLPHHHR